MNAMDFDRLFEPNPWLDWHGKKSFLFMMDDF